MDAGTGAPDVTWLYTSSGASICFNAWFMNGDAQRAVLLFWDGPRADAWHGPVASLVGDRYCWDFVGWPKGVYSFWPDEPDPACAADWCLRDSDPYTGANYGQALSVTGDRRKWFTCDFSGCATGSTCGCNGTAYFDGNSWLPEGGQP
jgi:hypothetical protein